jgi:hypothetical protein
LSLFPNKDDILTKEIESWIGFADSLKSEEDKKLFLKMLNDCYKYSIAINAKGELFPAESVLMALLFSQHRVIDWLSKQLITCSSCTSISSASTALEVQEKERQQIKEWHKEVFKDVKSNYECLSREDIQRFRVKAGL